MLWIANAVPKQVCRFLLNRYLGEILLEKVNVEQLSVDLVNGTGTISDVYLDVEHINEALLRSELPFELVEGFIGSIQVHIPYSKLLNDSCSVEMTGLELTLQPKPKCQTTDFVSSMIESVIGSMTTSIDLAKSFVEEQQSVDGSASNLDQKLHGIDALAQLIQIILSRIKINLKKTIVRLESTDARRENGSALEAQIDRIEFVDECVDSQSSSDDPVTEQPHQSQCFTNNGLQLGGELSKLVRLYGVRLFTDLFRKPENASVVKNNVTKRKPSEVDSVIDWCAAENACGKSVYKSCYQAEHLRCAESLLNDPCCSSNASQSSKKTSFLTVSNSDPLSSAHDTYQFNKSADSNVNTKYDASLSTDSMSASSSEHQNLHNWSNPIQFAHFASEKLSIRIRLKGGNNSGDAPIKREEVNVEMFLGSLNIFLTSTQLHVLCELVKSLFSRDSQQDFDESKNNKPMRDNDYFNVEMDLRRKLDEIKLPTSVFTANNASSGGNWSGDEKFYRSSKMSTKSKTHTIEENDFISIPMSYVSENSNDFVLINDDYKPSGINIPGTSKRDSVNFEPKNSISSPNSMDSAKADYTRCKICLTHFLLFLTHDDPLSTNVVHTATSVVSRWAEQFFVTCEKISPHDFKDPTSSAKIYNSACDVDHLRLIASPLVIEWVRTSLGRIQLSLTANKAMLLECLWGNLPNDHNTATNQDEEPSLVEFAAFVHENEDDQDPDIKLSLVTDDQNAYACTVLLNECHLLVDVTLLDRIHNLLICLTMPKACPQPKLVRNALLDRFLFEVPRSDIINYVNEDWSQSLSSDPMMDRFNCALDLFCPNLQLRLSFPVPDLRPTESTHRTPWWIRRIRNDFLEFNLNATHFKSVLGSNIARMGNFSIEFDAATVSFHDEEMAKTHKILHACKSDISKCCLDFKWDFVNRSLSLDQINSDSNNLSPDKLNNDAKRPENFLASLDQNCFKLSPSFDGPFSKKHVAHENEQLMIVGSKQEMRDFQKLCLMRCSMGVGLRFGSVCLFLPDKRLYELLYNRIINDLALWTPSNPGLQKCYQRTDFATSLFESCNAWLNNTYGVDKFAPCKPFNSWEDSDSDSDSATLKSASVKDQANKRGSAHKFSVLLQCGKLDAILCLRDSEEASEEPIVDVSSLRLIGRNLELFLVRGYGNDENISYSYVTSEIFNLKCCETPLSTPQTQVDSDNFGSNLDWIDIAEPTPAELASKTMRDDHFSLAIRSQFHPVENLKEFLITVGSRSTTVHFWSDKSSSENFWLLKLVRFFDIVEFPIDGFQAPKIINDIHLHAWNLALQYKPKSLPFVLRCHMDSLDVSTNVVQEASTFRFHVIVEESSLLLSGNTPMKKRNSSLPSFENYSTSSSLLRDFICVVKMGFFELNLINSNQTADEDATSTKMRSKPLQEIQIKNDLLEVKACSDSLVALSSILKHLATGLKSRSGSDVNLDSSGKADVCLNGERTNEEPPSQEQNIKDMMNSAMQDIKVPSPQSVNQPKRTQVRNHVLVSSSVYRRVLPREANVSNGPMTKSVNINYKLNAARGNLQAKPKRVAVESRSENNKAQQSFTHLLNKERECQSAVKNTADQRVHAVKYFDADDQILTLVDNHFPAPLQKHNSIMKLPADFPVPLLRYIVKDFTISCYLYGGKDFDAVSEQKVYSGLSVAQQTPKLRQKLNEARRNPFTCGGQGRDHTVAVEFYLNKLCCLHEVFPANFPPIARQVITVQEAQIRDHLLVSSINKLLYLHTSKDRPKPTYTPMVCLKLLHFSSNPELEQMEEECSLKISLLPIRLHIDQDTLQFMVDFSRDCNDLASKKDLVRERKSQLASNSFPVICVPRSPEKSISNYRTESLKVKSLERPYSASNSNAHSPGGTIQHSSVAITNFAESESEYESDSANLECCPTSTEPCEPASISLKRPHKTQLIRSRTVSTCSNKSDSRSSNIYGLYIKSFVFSPSVDIKLDYCGKHLHMEQQNALSSLLLGLSQLHSARIRLKELHNRHGLLGLDRVLSYALGEWLSDIRRNQLYSIVGGVGPVHTLMQVSQGFVDLFWFPVDQYRKDGHVVKGLQRGAQSFGVSTASAALELSQQLVGMVQSVAEFAFDIVNPNYPPKPNDLLQALARPYDFREGVRMACATVYRGLHETAEAITLATQEERARGRWAIRGVLRQATPTIIRPVVVASRATSHVLGGLRNQLKPDSWCDERNKWKDE